MAVTASIRLTIGSVTAALALVACSGGSGATTTGEPASTTSGSPTTSEATTT